jgi:hypothetical protein
MKDKKKSILDIDLDAFYREVLDNYGIKHVTIDFKNPGSQEIYKRFQWAVIRGTIANDLNLNFKEIMKEQIKKK